jgi:Protein of unknown function (DUF3574)
MRSLKLLFLSAALLAACSANLRAQSAAPGCQGAQHHKLVAELMFGRDIGHHVGVSEAAWMRFLIRQVTPRFPDGLTVVDAVGQWRDPRSGRIVREPSKLVVIVLPGKDDDQARLDAVAQAYKRQFRQQSVGLIVQPGCVLF